MKENLKSIAKEIVNSIHDKGLYSDFNYINQKELKIVIDKENTSINKDCDKGVKIRLWDGEKFLESATTLLSKEGLKSVASGLIERYEMSKHEIKSPKKLKVDNDIVEKDFERKLEKSFESLSLEEKTDKLMRIKDDILKIDDDVVNVRVIMSEQTENHIFVSNSKTLSQKISLGKIAMVAFVKCEDGTNRMVFKSLVDDDLKIFDKAYDSFEEFREDVPNMKKAKKLKGGKYKVLLSPKITGLLAHESFGHGMEADTMMKERALASEWIGKKIGDDNINIVDCPQIAGKHGEFYFDYEGNIAKKTYLVKNGVIKDPMADLYSKTELDLENSFNSRFESFDHKHYTRMSNTYFEPADESYKDMLKEIDDGIYVNGSAGGMEDPKGWGVQIQGCSGQRIKNGKLVDEFYDGFALTGFLPDIIKNISGVSKEFEIEGGGFCGKGHKEWVRVSEGGAYLKIDEVVLG